MKLEVVVGNKPVSQAKYRLWPFILSFIFVIVAIVSLMALFQYENKIEVSSWKALQQEQEKLDKLSSLYQLRNQIKVKLHDALGLATQEEKQSLFLTVHDIRGEIVENTRFLQDNAKSQEELDALLNHVNALEAVLHNQFYYQSLLVDFDQGDLAEDILYNDILPMQDYADSHLSEYYSVIVSLLHKQREKFTHEKQKNRLLINQVLAAVFFLALVIFVAVIVFVNRTNVLHKSFSDELESKVESRTLELYEAQQELNQSLASLKSILSAAPDAIITTDSYGTIVSVNPAVKSLFGYSSDELVGKKILALILVKNNSEDSGLAKDLNFKTFSQILAVKENERFTAKHKSGQEIPIELAMGRLISDGLEGYTFIIRNVKHNVMMEHRLQQQREMAELLRQAVNNFMVDSDIRSVSDFLLKQALEFTGSEYGFIGEVLYDDEGQPYLKTNALTNISWNQETRQFYSENAPKGLEFRNLKTLFGEVMVKRRVLISNHAMSDTRGGGLPEGHPALNCFLGVPVFYADKLIGMYGLANREGGYDQDIVDLLDTFSQSYGALIYVKRMLDTQDQLYKVVVEERNQAEKSNKAKSAFLSSMSHELRTPLNAVLGYSQLLALGDSSDSDKEMIQEINKAGSHLLELIEGVLDLSKVESEQFELINERFKLKPFMEDCINLIQPLATEKNITVVCTEVVDDLVLYADRTRLKQAVINLLSNAIKYNIEKGSVIFEYEIRANELLELRVVDTGTGIDKEDVPKLFQPFNRLGHEGGSIEGTGIGLNYSQKIINMMGGEIKYKANKPKGSIFSIFLPLVDSVQ